MTAVPLHPARVVGGLRKALPRDGVLLVDSGAHRAFASTTGNPINRAPMFPRPTSALWAGPSLRRLVSDARRPRGGHGGRRRRLHAQGGVEVATAARYRSAHRLRRDRRPRARQCLARAHKLGATPDELTRLPDHDWAAFSKALGCRGETVRAPSELASFSREFSRTPNPPSSTSRPTRRLQLR